TREASEESALYGRPDEIACKGENLRQLGVGYVLLNGGASAAHDSLRRFAREVMPAFAEEPRAPVVGWDLFPLIPPQAGSPRYLGVAIKLCGSPLSRGRAVRQFAPMINKIVQSMAQAMADIRDGAVVLLGGFGSIGQPNALIDGLIEQGAKDLTVVSNNAGVGRAGLA